MVPIDSRITMPSNVFFCRSPTMTGPQQLEDFVTDVDGVFSTLNLLTKEA